MSINRREFCQGAATVALAAALGMSGLPLAAAPWPTVRRARCRRRIDEAAGPARHDHGQRQGAGHHRRICLDDLPALRAFPGDDVPGTEEALHRHRQGPLHLPRIPARYAGERRVHAGALRRREGLRASISPWSTRCSASRTNGSPPSRCRRCSPSPSRPASPSRVSTPAWRIRSCSTASKTCASSAIDEFKVQSTPTFFINGDKYAGALTIEQMAKAIDPQLKGG